MNSLPEVPQITRHLESGWSGNREGWGKQVNLRDPLIHYFRNGDSLCGKKTGGGYMSGTPYYPQCRVCSDCLDTERAPSVEPKVTESDNASFKPKSDLEDT